MILTCVHQQACSNNPGPENCQTNILSLEEGLSNVNIYSLSTVGTTNMVVQSGIIEAIYSANNGVYPDTIAIFQGAYVPTGWNYLGCYSDNPSARTFSYYLVVPGGQGATTIQSCVAACSALGYSLAGIEYANECCKFPLLHSRNTH
jgi:glucan 1,3-beta-glucosidase